MTDGFDINIPQEIISQVRNEHQDMRTRFDAAIKGVDENNPDDLIRAISEMFKPK